MTTKALLVFITFVTASRLYGSDSSFFTNQLDDLKYDLGSSKSPTCYICHAWSKKQDDKVDDLFCSTLDCHLDRVGILTYFDQRKDERGASHAGSIVKFIDNIGKVDFYIVVCTPTLFEKYSDNSYVSIEISAILDSIITQQHKKVIPVWIRGDREKSIPLPLKGFDSVYFRNPSEYYHDFFKLLGKFFPYHIEILAQKSKIFNSPQIQDNSSSVFSLLSVIQHNSLKNSCDSILRKINMP